jgi:DNA excision repair protein ERCC-4
MTKKEQEEQAISKFFILTANNEQLPYKFPNSKAYIMPLGHGDYTIEYGGKPYYDEIVVERKGSVSEIYGAVGSGRERWERELENLSKIKIALVLCEFSYLDLVTQAYGAMSPSAVYGSICSWHATYGIPFIFCENRVNARAYLYKLFRKYVEHKILRLK